MYLVPSPIPSAVRSSPTLDGMSLPWHAVNPEQLLHLAKLSCDGAHGLERMANPQSTVVPPEPAPAPPATTPPPSPLTPPKPAEAPACPAAAPPAAVPPTAPAAVPPAPPAPAPGSSLEPPSSV